MILKKILYSQLNARQKENYNFQKLSAVLAEYGFTTLRLSDDWQGADFIALHVSGEVLRVQLKSRLGFYKKYQGKSLYLAFRVGDSRYFYPHDEVLAKALKVATLGSTVSWTHRGGYSYPRLSKDLLTMLEPYRLESSVGHLPLK
jgi:hypothetical protein